VKLDIKNAMMKAIQPSYNKYIKTCKPEKAYKMEDIELAIEKMIKIN
jgi:hypothetical protein